MPWHYSNPVRITAGEGALEGVGALVPASSRVLRVTSAGTTRRGTTARVTRLLEAAGCTAAVLDRVEPNPELETLDAFAAEFAPGSFDAIVALGGGSAIDAGKVLSVLLPRWEPFALRRALRDGGGQSWSARLPTVAIPTTAGTGAEITPFATVWDATRQRKHSVAGELLFPVHALLDPSLLRELPPDETLHTALDAISHALESLWNRHRTPVTEAFALQALSASVQALPRVLADPSDMAQRARLQQASLLSGLAIAHTRTALAHSVSYPLTLRHGVPHGLACSFTLPVLLEENLDALAAQLGHRELFSALLALLQSIDFRGRLLRYVTPAGVWALRSEMCTPGRTDNFIFAADIDRLLHRAFG